MVIADFNIPDINGGTTREELRQVKDYLYQLSEQLRYLLNNLGEENLSAELVNQIKNSGVSRADIAKSLDQMVISQQAAIKKATALITGNNGGNFVTMFDANGLPYETLWLDTGDMDTAQEVWRWNGGGLGHSSTGVDGPYTTAITADGSIVADFIRTGTLGADVAFLGQLRGVFGTFQHLVAGVETAQRVEIGTTGDGDPYVTMYDSNGNASVSQQKDGTYYTDNVRLVRYDMGTKTGLAVFVR